LVQTVDGAITLNGTGGSGTENFQIGTALLSGNVVQITGSGMANISGAGGSGTANNYGLLLQNASVTTAGGGTMFTGNGGTGTDAGQIGVAMILGSDITDAAGGNIMLNGMGGDGTIEQFGVLMGINAPSNITTTTGDVTITGTAGNGTDTNIGIAMETQSVVQSSGGTISMTGFGMGTGNENHGIRMRESAVVQNAVTGAINMQGTGGDGVNANQGIRMQDTGTSITAFDGGITLSGTSGNATGLNNEGITIIGQATVEAVGSGVIDLTGNAVGGNFNNKGVVLSAPGTFVRSNGGGISITGTGAGTNDNNIGISLENQSSVEDIADGSIVLNGTGGSGNATNYGVLVIAASEVSSNQGDITIIGNGGAGIGNANDGVRINGAGSQVLSVQGNIQITANGGSSGSGSRHIGLYLFNFGAVQTVDGNITVNGIGGDGAGNLHNGVLLASQSSIESTGIGNVSITGTGGAGAFGNTGVWLQDSNTQVAVNGGSLTMNGTGGPTTGDFSIGVLVGFEADVLDNGMGSISIVGNGASANAASSGVLIQNEGSTVISNGGGITMTGNGGTSIAQDATGLFTFEGLIQDTSNGAIVLNGNGGTAPDSGKGTWIETNSVITAASGDVQITGTAINVSGSGNEGLFIDTNSLITALTGNVELTGTSALVDFPAIDIVSIGAPITAGGNITATANIGEINTPEGIPATAIFEATNTNINGTLAPGQSPGQLTTNGNLTMGVGDTYEWELQEITTAGTTFDQIVVNGTIDISDAALTLIDNFTGTLTEGDEIIIVTNDGLDAVVGIFNGLTTTTPIPFNGQFVFVHYDGGDGNDVSLVVDSTPTAICQDITVQLDASGNATIVPSDINNGSFDPDGPVTLSVNQDTFSCADVGTPVTVTLTVTDSTGNTDTCTAVVTVTDVTPPIIGCVADFTVSTSADTCTAVVVFANPSVIDNCSATGDIIVTQVTGIASGGTFPQGANQVGFSATDEAGNVSFCSFIITVEDNTDPVAVCMDVTLMLDNTGNATITAGTVNGGSTDNCGIASSTIDISSFSCADVGPNTVTLTVTDINGNTDSCTAIVTVVDTTAPTAVCQDITVELGPDGTVTLDGSLLDNGSSDACGAGILTFTTDPAVLTCSDIGQLFVDLIVTDENNNSSTCTAIVTVEDNLDPVLVCQDTTIELGPDGTAMVDPMQLLDMTNPLDNCGLSVLTVDVPMVTCNDIGGTIDITVFASDSSGNFSSCVATVTVIDTTGPVFDQASLPVGPLTRMIDPATGFYRLEDFRIGVSSTDNCSEGLLPISVSQFPFAGTPLFEGTHDITITAMDDEGNESDHVFVLIVEPALGVDDTEIALSTLTMYPNPASDKVILSNPQNIQLKDVKVFDLTGRLVQKVDLSKGLIETIIDVSQLQSASYMFVISTEKASITKQIIKE
jgi:hypothetical protein